MSLGDCDSRAGRDRDLSEHRHRATVPEQEEWSRPGHGNQAQLGAQCPSNTPGGPRPSQKVKSGAARATHKHTYSLPQTRTALCCSSQGKWQGPSRLLTALRSQATPHRIRAALQNGQPDLQDRGKRLQSQLAHAEHSTVSREHKNYLKC